VGERVEPQPVSDISQMFVSYLNYSSFSLALLLFWPVLQRMIAKAWKQE
jgi:hypothetical protein